MKYQVIWLLLATVTAPAFGFDWGLGGRAGYTFSDNVAQAPTGESASILGTELAAAVEHASRTLVVDAEGNYIYRHFLNGEYDAEAQPQLRGTLDWSPLPERFRVVVTDTYGQLALNPAEGLLPSEYENANVLTVGPAFIWPLSLDTRIQVAGEYRHATFDVSPVDTERQLGELSVEHDLTPLISMFAGASRSRTKFDVAGTQSDFDINSLLFGLNAVGRRSALTLDAGLDELNDGGESFKGARYDIAYERQVSTDSRIFLSATREIADAADVFSLAQISDPALAGIRDVQVTSQPFVRNAYLAGYALTGHRLSFVVAGGYRQEDFRLVPEDATTLVGVDRDIHELSLDALYIWSSRTSIGARAELLQERFVSGVSSDDMLLTLSYLRRIAPRMAVDARVQRIQRSHSPRDFEENRFFLYLRYTVRELPARRNEAFDRAFERRVRRVRDSAGEADPAPPAGLVPQAAPDPARPAADDAT